MVEWGYLVNQTSTLTLKLSDRFVSPSQGQLDFSRLIVSLVNYIEAAPGFRYRIIVGSDSEAKNGEATEYVSAVVVHRVGAGGIYFWQRVVGGKCYSLKERIYNEALLSLDLARRLLDGLLAQNLLELDLEIHVDVGQVGETREIINEITGMIRGSGFQVRTKPDSFGASKVADRHT